jgi:hypothetical protein
MNRKVMPALVVMVALVAVWSCCKCPPLSPPPVAERFPGVVACPNHGRFQVWVGADSGTITDVPLAGGTTLIPEFHDCQRLIDTTHRYGPLAAIWVPPQYLGTIIDSLHVRQPVAIAAAVIHAWDGSYEPLGIRQKWNCLYLVGGGAGGLSARMVATGGPEECSGSTDPDRLQDPVTLAVERRQFAGLGDDDYPSVGRWDRDQDRAQPYDYIGFRCNDGWCEVHRPKESEFLPSEAYFLDPAETPLNRRVYEVKGWYDEQYLDVGSGSAKHPLSVLGTMVPDSALDTRTVDDFRGQWVPVGVTALSASSSVYRTKLGLEAGHLPRGGQGSSLTPVAICWEAGQAACENLPDAVRTDCQATPSTDPGRWWFARVGDPGRKPVYKCVDRREHLNVGHIPGTARWSWREDDATQWWRCSEGCCTLRP